MDKEYDYSASERIDVYISDFEKVFSSVQECIDFKEKYPKIIEYCLQLEGQIRGIGKHAAALIVAKDNLKTTDRCNLALRNDVVTVNWDKKDAEYVGMLKIDVLGLANLSIMHYAKDLIKQNHDIDLDFNNIDLKDKNVLKEFANGNCVGIFQFGTYGLKKLCKALKINSFDLLVHASSMYRPASLRNGMVDKFKQRHILKQDFAYGNKLDSILYKTKGIILYQEQIMQIVNEIAGLSLTVADKIRKLLDSENQSLLEKYKYDFLYGCKTNGINREEAKKIWDIMLSYGGYSFNKSHAVAYTMLSFLNMYIKHYYPIEFICAGLSFSTQEKKQELLSEALRLGIPIFSPKIGISDVKNWVSKQNKIYMPFIEIKGVGEISAEKIVSIGKNKDGFFENDVVSKKYNGLLEKLDAYNEKTIVRDFKLIPYIF